MSESANGLIRVIGPVDLDLLQLGHQIEVLFDELGCSTEEVTPFIDMKRRELSLVELPESLITSEPMETSDNADIACLFVEGTHKEAIIATLALSLSE